MRDFNWHFWFVRVPVLVLFIAFLVYCTTEGYGTDDIMGIIEVPTPENLTPRGLFSVVYVLITVRWFWHMFKGRK